MHSSDSEPHNGQVLMVLSMDNTCSATSFDMELCAEKLQTLGVQAAAGEWRRLIEEAVLKPEVRRYLFYNSRASQIAIAVLGWRHRLDQLCVVTEVAVPAAEETSCEESPLLPSGESFRKEPVMCNELLHLIPEGPPEEEVCVVPLFAFYSLPTLLHLFAYLPTSREFTVQAKTLLK
ncbi:hypothetical protein ASZ78_011582 [Callipepla squamata]|uniref:Uncharacterized protein n=1 Tax=Callipepla squamata TaxID=9009 RepID=A0A226NG98_CALSU|nr:hypothetical protein ASZ78_011582 [Callipepla squamata]